MEEMWADRCVGRHILGSSGNSRVGMVDEGRVSARFVLRSMHGVSSYSSSPPFPDADGDLEGGTGKNLGCSDVKLVLYLCRKLELRRRHLTIWRRRRLDIVHSSGAV
jgi:hypothetical protein